MKLTYATVVTLTRLFGLVLISTLLVLPAYAGQKDKNDDDGNGDHAEK
jgi:hypothetical protein